MSVTVKVEGLRAVAENLATLNKRVQENISRTSLRAAARVLTRAIKGKTYSTFNKVTGMVGRGFTAGVARTDRTSTMRFASVFQREQTISTRTASGRLAGALLAKRNSKGRVPQKATAFWWRFVDKGTKTRAGRGSISARPWIAPAASAASSEAVEAFRDSMKKRIEAEAATLPSTRGKP